MKLDGGPRSYLILDFLRRELSTTPKSPSYTLAVPGVCIRRLIVNHEGRGDVLNALTPRHPGRSIDDHSADAMDHDEKMRQYRISVEALEQKLEQIYLPNLLFVIPTLIYLDSGYEPLRLEPEPPEQLNSLHNQTPLNRPLKLYFSIFQSWIRLLYSLLRL